MSSGVIIVKERKKRGWTQAQLAHKLHISRTTLGKIERDEQLLDIYTLIKVLQVFKITANTLIHCNQRSYLTDQEKYFMQKLREEDELYHRVLEHPQTEINKWKHFQ